MHTFVQCTVCMHDRQYASKFEKYACTLDNLSFYCLYGFFLMFWKLEIACSTMEKESSKTTFAFVPPQKSSVFSHEWHLNESELRNGLPWCHQLHSILNEARG